MYVGMRMNPGEKEQRDLKQYRQKTVKLIIEYKKLSVCLITTAETTLTATNCVGITKEKNNNNKGEGYRKTR